MTGTGTMAGTEGTATAAAETDVRLTRAAQPAVIVIFGATGDLTQRKLVPGLYSLATQQLLPPETAIIGVARRDIPDDEFRAHLRAGVETHGRFPIDEDVWEGFAGRLRYLSAPFDDRRGFERLRAMIEEEDARRGTRGNRLFYLATSPEFFPVIAESLGAVGLADEGDGTGRFARLVVEKPFGHDLASARALNTRLGAVFRRAAGLPDRPLPGEGDGPEPARAALRQRDLRAHLEPPVRRPRADHGLRGARRGVRGAATTTRAARCSTSSRTTCSRCSRSSRWSRRRGSRAATCATRR